METCIDVVAMHDTVRKLRSKRAPSAQYYTAESFYRSRNRMKFEPARDPRRCTPP